MASQPSTESSYLTMTLLTRRWLSIAIIGLSLHWHAQLNANSSHIAKGMQRWVHSLCLNVQVNTIVYLHVLYTVRYVWSYTHRHTSEHVCTFALSVCDPFDISYGGGCHLLCVLCIYSCKWACVFVCMHCVVHGCHYPSCDVGCVQINSIVILWDFVYDIDSTYRNLKPIWQSCMHSSIYQIVHTQLNAVHKITLHCTLWTCLLEPTLEMLLSLLQCMWQMNCVPFSALISQWIG